MRAMNNSNIKYPYFFCSVVAGLLCYGQAMANVPLIYISLMGYLSIIAYYTAYNFSLPILLFFLPWSKLMRLSPDSYSFYTFGLVISCAVSMLRNKLRLKEYAVITGIVIVFISLISKLIDGSGIAFSYIAFIMMLVVMPAVKQEIYKSSYDFYQLVVFLSSGIIFAALCAMQYASYSNISRFIQVDTYNVIIRRSGFYGDPNFYNAQITAALGGCMMLLLKELKWKRLLCLLVFAFLLIYCGALSGSKSFVLVTCCMALVWVSNIGRIKERPLVICILLLATVGIILVVANSTMFKELIDTIIYRFSKTTDINSFTTNRVELWELYLNELFSNSKVFFLGKGISSERINNYASHNTILQMVYEVGILGAPVLAYWIYCYLHDAPSDWKKDKKNKGSALVVVVGVYVPWLAIDMLLFDEFFLFQWYAFMALYETSQPKKQNLPQTPEPKVNRPGGRWRRINQS